ncbi:SDR family NAD(P)-dependent oxidoreductase [Mycolicibacterium baixiangningiae]|uniref:SDR family NAD(P)-dependent oxidoreductase n=1 Tax=Mycolicibacterium baixiangningiae TaxID=2761578 RepID=UPI001D0287D8|nr:SDR family oxidoreductase [Mycolicibacterium baixiangningiae]
MISWTTNLPDTVVVTGTSSGIGLQCAVSLTQQGVHVIGVDAQASPADLAGLANYIHVKGSVTVEDTWDRVVAELRDKTGALGFLSVAGVLEAGLLENDDLATWRRIWEINVLGTVLGLKKLLPALHSAEYAAVVALTSVVAHFADQQLAAYSSSKSALTGAIRTIALDYARSGIRFNMLAPGPTKAGLFERHLSSTKDPDSFLQAREARHPLGRILEATEIANAAMYLLSPESSALFATTVLADGGLTAGFDFQAAEVMAESAR